MLTLCQIEEGNYSGLFVVGGVFGEDFIDALVIFFGEIEVGFGCVVGCVDVLFVIAAKRERVRSLNTTIISDKLQATRRHTPI